MNSFAGLLKNCITKVDIFGKMYIFHEKKTESFKTIVGGIFSFCLYICVFVVCFLYGNEIYIREKPEVSNSDNFIDDSIIKKNEFPFFMIFMSKNGEMIENIDTILNFQTSFVIFNKNGTQTWKAFKGLNSCDSKQFVKYKEFMDESLGELSNGIEAKCINPEIYFQNEYTSPGSTLINIRMSLCNPKVSQCHKDLEKISQEFYISSIFQDSFIDTKNYTTPINYVKNSVTQQISSGILKRNYLRFVINLLETDVGWILEEKVLQDFVSFKSIKSDVNPTYDNLVYMLTLESPRMRTKIYRRYMKIQDLFAKIGGIYSALSLLLSFILHNYINFAFLKNISDLTFEKPSKSNDISVVEKIKTSKKNEITTSQLGEKKDEDLSRNVVVHKEKKNNYIINLQEIKDNKKKVFNFKDLLTSSLSDKNKKENSAINYFEYVKSYITCNEKIKMKYKGMLKELEQKISFGEYVRNQAKTQKEEN